MCVCRNSIIKVTYTVMTCAALDLVVFNNKQIGDIVVE